MNIRAFFSIELPSPIKQLIADQLIVPMQKKFHDHDITWTKTENLHVTLQFIKEIDIFDVEKLIHNVKIELENTNSFYLKLGQLELFPNLSKPRVLSLAVSPADTLTHLSKCIGLGIFKTNYPIEMRPYRGHLTLGKIALRRNTNEIKAQTFSIANIPLPDLGIILISNIILLRSEPSSTGSHYTELAKFALHKK